MKKMLSLGVILLFLGLVLAPCINGDIENNRIDRSNYKPASLLERLSDRLLELNVLLNEYDSFDCGCAYSIYSRILEDTDNIFKNFKNNLLSDSSFSFRPLVCVVLSIVLIPLFLLFSWANIWVNLFNYNPLITPIAIVVYAFALERIINLWGIGFEFKCWPPLP